jgi:ABC-type dipeptide/oligopeptide/nickel transport system permease component
MGSYLLIRVIRWITGLALILFITYALMHFGAGNPIDILVNEGESQNWDPARIAALKEKFGLDRPFLVQFTTYIRNLFQGELGMSIREQRDVAPMVRTKLPISMQLGIAATILIILFGIPLGVLAAMFHNRWPDTLIVGVVIIFQAIPQFVVAPVLTVVFVLWLKIMQVPVGWKGLFHPQAILPLLVLTLSGVPVIVRQTRAAVLDIAKSDYIRTARAKGLSEKIVLLKHILRPALIPVTTVAGLMMITLVNGALFVETVFNIPGFGNLTRQGMLSADYPIIMIVVLVGTLIVMVGNLLVDLSYPLIDPRITHH